MLGFPLNIPTDAELSTANAAALGYHNALFKVLITGQQNFRTLTLVCHSFASSFTNIYLYFLS